MGGRAEDLLCCMDLTVWNRERLLFPAHFNAHFVPFGIGI